MRFIRYGKYVGEPADAVDLEELVKRLGNFFLQSGFESQFYGVSETGPGEVHKGFAGSHFAGAAGRRPLPTGRDERRIARVAEKSASCQG